jgi:choline dehydrogenase-like flavoprotein
MFIDARTIPMGTVLESEICVVGAGAAGIAIAREFNGGALRVAVVESGDLSPDAATQALAAGESVGQRYFALDTTRLRFFGGSTNHWGGMCRPFDDIDFEARDWIPHSGWPIGKAELRPYYVRAQDVCQLDAPERDLAYWAGLDEFPLLPLLGHRVATRFARISRLARRSFGRIYADEMRQSKNVTTYLNANVTEIETDETASTVTGLRVACLSGNRFSVRAKVYVLALGGIENPRLLLLSNRHQPAGLANQHDHVGRFFMDHPRFVAARMIPTDKSLSVGFYDRHPVGETNLKGYLCLSPSVQRSERLIDVQLRISPVLDPAFMESLESTGMSSLKYLWRHLETRLQPDDLQQHVANVLDDLTTWRTHFVPTAPLPLPAPEVFEMILESPPGEKSHLVANLFGGIAFASFVDLTGNAPIDHVEAVARVEPAPNPDSRVTLGRERDALGQNRVQLDWRLSALDHHSARRALEIVGAEIGRANIGRLQIARPELTSEELVWPPDTDGGYHHMGTTRMSDDAKQGVVDKNCQVHGISNLFVAGSSVFPTAGSGTPTLTVVTLALRLADHIKSRMG